MTQPPDSPLVEQVALAISSTFTPGHPILVSSKEHWRNAAQAALAVLQPLLDERDAKIADLDAECERAWEAYRIAHDQAMSNGEALMEARAALTESKEPK
jgi:hypothetical protein